MNNVDPIWIQIIGMMVVMIAAAMYVVYWDKKDSQRKSFKSRAAHKI